MKKFTKFMLILVCIFLVLGVGFSAAGAAMGATVKDMSLSEDWKDGVQIMKNIILSDKSRHSDDEEEDNWNSKAESQGNDDVQTFTFETAKQMQMNLCSDELILRETDGDKIIIEVERENAEDVKIQSSSSGLEVKTTRTRSDRSIIISYPKGTRFSEMEIEVDAGSVCVEDALLADKLEIQIGAGEFVNASTISVNELDVEVGAGSAEITDLTAKRIDGECSLGSLMLEINGKETDYNYKLECGVGEISIDGESYGGFAKEKKITNTGASGEIDLECGVGEIEISFSTGN